MKRTITNNNSQILSARRNAKYYRRQAVQTYELNLRESQALWNLFRRAARRIESTKYKLSHL
jgi:hypothetical protein